MVTTVESPRGESVKMRQSIYSINSINSADYPATHHDSKCFWFRTETEHAAGTVHHYFVGTARAVHVATSTEYKK